MLRFSCYLSAVLAMTGITACQRSDRSVSANPQFVSSTWPEADLLFRGDPFWVGADDAYSIDLGEGRTLWLFADTVIDPSGRRTRAGARLIRNSVGLQIGSNPSQAKMQFYWRRDEQSQPVSFFPEQDRTWFWPGHGIKLDDRILIFLMRVRSNDSALGFELYDWDAVMVNKLAASPLDWRLDWLEKPKNDFGVIVGSASVLALDDYLYAFGSQETMRSHPIYVVRWPRGEVVRNDLSGIQWWAGAATGWIRQSELKVPPVPVLQNGQTELTIHFDEKSGKFLTVQTMGFGPAVITLRSANELTGPWTAPDTICRPPEFTRPKIMIYAGKAHPQLSGADLVLTYATNSTDLSELFSDSLIYYPRFVKLTRRRSGGKQ